jgi:SlyX protein
MENDRTEDRFLRLETKMAYQEKLIAELHEVLLERGKEIDSLLTRMESSERILRDGPGEDPSNDAPPHY